MKIPSDTIISTTDNLTHGQLIRTILGHADNFHIKSRKAILLALQATVKACYSIKGSSAFSSDIYKQASDILTYVNTHKQRILEEAEEIYSLKQLDKLL